MKNRTNMDWSKHELIIEENNSYILHCLKIPNSIHLNVKFINMQDKLFVLGDFGSWIFERSFIPNENFGEVIDVYWSEKIDYNIKYSDYSPEETYQEILNNLVYNIFECYGIDITEDEEEKIIKEFKSTSYCDIADNEYLNSLYKEKNLDNKKIDKIKNNFEYYSRCSNYVDDEFEYISEMRNHPNNIDSENYIFIKKIDDRLNIIFDAFEEICERLKNLNTK